MKAICNRFEITTPATNRCFFLFFQTPLSYMNASNLIYFPCSHAFLSPCSGWWLLRLNAWQIKYASWKWDCSVAVNNSSSSSYFRLKWLAGWVRSWSIHSIQVSVIKSSSAIPTSCGRVYREECNPLWMKGGVGGANSSSGWQHSTGMRMYKVKKKRTEILDTFLWLNSPFCYA